MLDFDPTKTYKPILEKLAKTTNPRHRKMLETLLQHSRGEVEGDLEAVLGTLAPNPIYRGVRRGPPEAQPKGMEEIRAFYINEIFGGGRHIFEGNKDRIVVDDNTIITEGTMRILQWGHDLAELGAPIEDKDATYLMTARVLIVWPFDENCKAIGEESWSTGPSKPLEKIADEDVPESFKAYIRGKLKARKA